MEVPSYYSHLGEDIQEHIWRGWVLRKRCPRCVIDGEIRLGCSLSHIPLARMGRHPRISWKGVFREKYHKLRDTYTHTRIKFHIYLINIKFSNDLVKQRVQVIEQRHNLKKEYKDL